MKSQAQMESSLWYHTFYSAVALVALAMSTCTKQSHCQQGTLDLDASSRICLCLLARRRSTCFSCCSMPQKVA